MADPLIRHKEHRHHDKCQYPPLQRPAGGFSKLQNGLFGKSKILDKCFYAIRLASSRKRTGGLFQKRRGGKSGKGG
jgi:hypothetical protein